MKCDDPFTRYPSDTKALVHQNTCIGSPRAQQEATQLLTVVLFQFVLALHYPAFERIFYVRIQAKFHNLILAARYQ